MGDILRTDFRETMKFRIALASTLLSTFLVGCGGGGEAPADTPRTPQSGGGTGGTGTGTGTGEPSTPATPAAYVPSPKIGLVFRQNGEQVPVTVAAGVATIHLKHGALEILVPTSKSYVRLYLGYNSDTVYEYGSPVTIGGNVVAREQVMPTGGWYLWGTSAGSHDLYDFNYFRPADLVPEGTAYSVLRTAGIDTVYPDSTSLLIYLSGSSGFQTSVPQDGYVEYFKITYDEAPAAPTGASSQPST